jgi:hypothetical protein
MGSCVDGIQEKGARTEGAVRVCSAGGVRSSCLRGLAAGPGAGGANGEEGVEWEE